MPIAAAVALVPQVIALVQQGIVGATLLWSWIVNLRNTARQTGEWTPEAETAFIEGLIARTNDPAYQPDPDTVPLGLIAPPPQNVPATPAGTTVPGNAILICSVKPSGGDRETWCAMDGNCFVVKRSQMIEKSPKLFLSPATGMLFYLL